MSNPGLPWIKQKFSNIHQLWDQREWSGGKPMDEFYAVALFALMTLKSLENSRGLLIIKGRKMVIV